MTVEIEIIDRVFYGLEDFCSANGLDVKEYMSDAIMEKYNLDKYGDLNEKLTKKVNIESYLLDFSGDIYGERITVMLREFRRPEQKFTDLYELKDVLQADIAGRRLWHFHN